MKKLLVGCLLGILGLGSPIKASESLAQSKGCLSCHGLEKRIVGPAYREVAKKYQGQDVVERLSEKVMKGGGGVWGPVPMPPNAVSKEDARTLVQWILQLK